jgi:hypothetical protein
MTPPITPPITPLAPATLTAREAVGHLAERTGWGWATLLKLKHGRLVYAAAPAEFAKAAVEARIALRGRQALGEPHEDIPPEFWETADLEPLNVAAGDADRARAVALGRLGSDLPDYVDVVVPRDAVDRAWPRAPLLERFRVTLIVAWQKHVLRR